MADHVNQAAVLRGNLGGHLAINMARVVTVPRVHGCRREHVNMFDHSDLKHAVFGGAASQ